MVRSHVRPSGPAPLRGFGSTVRVTHVTEVAAEQVVQTPVIPGIRPPPQLTTRTCRRRSGRLLPGCSGEAKRLERFHSPLRPLMVMGCRVVGRCPSTAPRDARPQPRPSAASRPFHSRPSTRPCLCNARDPAGSDHRAAWRNRGRTAEAMSRARRQRGVRRALPAIAPSNGFVREFAHLDDPEQTAHPRICLEPFGKSRRVSRGAVRADRMRQGGVGIDREQSRVRYPNPFAVEGDTPAPGARRDKLAGFDRPPPCVA